MKIDELEEAVLNHTGVFACSGLGRDGDTKTISFKHIPEPPDKVSEVPDAGKLKEFYASFGSLTLYHHEASDDAAFHIANPAVWSMVHEEFSDWVDDLDEHEEEELLPEWINDCIAIGEIPYSGNYLLMPLSGEMSGHVFEFEHDGFEFIELASDILDFVVKALNPDSRSLTKMASHMTFTEAGEDKQWWIEEMRDNQGQVVKTEA